MKRVLQTAVLVLAILIPVGCGCQAKSSGAKNPESDVAAVTEQAAAEIKALKADTTDLDKQLDTAGAAVETSAKDLEEFVQALPEPPPASAAPVIAADKLLQQTAIPAIAAAKVDAGKIEDVTKQLATLAQALGKIRLDVKNLAKDRDNGWTEASTEKTRADDGMRRDFLAVGVLGVLALGLGIYFCATGNLKIGGLSIAGGLAVIIGAMVGVWMLDHWWQVAFVLVGIGVLAVLAALAWTGKLGAQAKSAVQTAITAGENAHIVNQNWIANLEAKVQSLEQKLGGSAPPVATPPAEATAAVPVSSAQAMSN
jgi:hypothetical protein